MKKPLLITLSVLFLWGCSGSNYKKKAVEYLKTKIANPASVDTVKFLKPDSIYTAYNDTPDFRSLKNSMIDFEADGDSVNAKRIAAIIEQRAKSTPKILVGWDVKLIYKAKNKKGAIQTDTCRFTFSSNLSEVKDLNGVDL
jgi:hypothetical protein